MNTEVDGDYYLSGTRGDVLDWNLLPLLKHELHKDLGGLLQGLQCSLWRLFINGTAGQGRNHGTPYADFFIELKLNPKYVGLHVAKF